MWWKLKKIKEDDREIIYAYGYESHETSGRIRIEKETEAIYAEQLATGDTEQRFLSLGPHVWRICFREGAPDERMIAVG